MTAVELIAEIERVSNGVAHDDTDELGRDFECPANDALDEIETLIERWRLLGSQK